MTDTIHAAPCRRCPSAHSPPDPEAEQIRAWVLAGQMRPRDAVFPCGWRPQKLCRGVCDYIGVTAGDVR